MLNRLQLGLIILLCLAASYLGWQNQRHKIAYVDSVKLLNGYQAMLDARKAYGSKAKLWQANVDTLTVSVQHAIQAYERGVARMTPKERSLATGLLRAKQKELANYQRTIQSTAQQEDTKDTQRVVAQVNAFLERYGKSHDYDLILVATPAGSIAYAQNGLDLSDEVIKGLNQEYSKSSR